MSKIHSLLMITVNKIATLTDRRLKFNDKFN